jgi:hypothetical protein
MKKLLDFENDEKGYKPFVVNKENVRANIGKRICYVDYIDPDRGAYFVRYGTIHSIRYSRLFLDNMNKEVDVRFIKEAGIEIEAVS